MNKQDVIYSLILLSQIAIIILVLTVPFFSLGPIEESPQHLPGFLLVMAEFVVVISFV